MPEHFDEVTTPATEDKQLARMGIAPKRLLGKQRQSVEALAHVGVAGGQPHPHAARNRDHRRPAVRALITAETVAGSTAPKMRTRAPAENSMSITPAGKADKGAGVVTGSGARATAANAGMGWDGPHN